MPAATRTESINAPLEQVWPVLADFTRTYRWNPVVPVSRPVGEKTTGLGARRRCEFSEDGRKWLEEEIIDFDETNHRYTLRLMEGPEKPPVDDMTIRISAQRLSAQTAQVTITAQLSGRGPLQKVMAGVGAVALRRVLRQLMAGLDRHVTTGEEIAYVKQLRRS